MFLYDSHGTAIAHRRSVEDRWLWDTHGRWIGWFPWIDSDAYSKDGTYLASVVGNRLLRRTNQPYRGYPGYPGYPGYAGYPGYGGHAGYVSMPSGFRDLDLAT